ncbi:MAG: hypothetical protein QM706_20965 [Nitrospira sp.]
MPTLRYILFLSALSMSTIGLVLLQAKESSVPRVQALSTAVDTMPIAVEEGAKVTVRVRITPGDNPDESYSDTEQFIQGEHTVPPGIEARVAGMHPGEIKTFPLSADEGFGPHDETKIRMVPTIDLPPETQEGDTIGDEAGNYARIILITPEVTLIDLNHPLAGKPLQITLQVVTIENQEDDRDTTGVGGETPHRESIMWRVDRNNGSIEVLL